MRVITGSARGRRLQSPRGIDVRPTSDRVKEAMFSAIQFDIEGRRVLDLFAGSGQLGIEALSRGAASCVFIDVSSENVDLIRANVAVCGFSSQARILNSDYAAGLHSLREPIDIAFLDPPYAAGLLQSAIEAAAVRMSYHGVILCEHDAKQQLSDETGRFRLDRQYRYGAAAVSIYRIPHGGEGAI